MWHGRYGEGRRQEIAGLRKNEGQDGEGANGGVAGPGGQGRSGQIPMHGENGCGRNAGPQAGAGEAPPACGASGPSGAESMAAQAPQP